MRSTNWHGYRVAAWVGQALLGAAMLWELVQGEWLPAAALAGFLIVSFLFVAFERKLPTLFDLIFVIAALINAGGWAWDLYNKPVPTTRSRTSIRFLRSRSPPATCCSTS